MRKLKSIIALVAAIAPGCLMATGVEPERQDLFAKLIQMNGCRMNNFQPSEMLLRNLEKYGFDQEEVRLIGQKMMEDGVAVRQGNFFVLKSGSC